MGDARLIHALIRFNCLFFCFIPLRRLSFLGNPNDAMVMLSRSPTVICCSSTFCLYPALSRGNGVSYLQHTSLLAGGKQPIINDHVQWISADHVTFTHPGGGKGQVNSPEFIKMVVERLTPPSSSLKPNSNNNNGHISTSRKMQTASPTTASVESHSVVPTNQLTNSISPIVGHSKDKKQTEKKWVTYFFHIDKRYISHRVFFSFLFGFVLFFIYRIIFQ